MNKKLINQTQINKSYSLKKSDGAGLIFFTKNLIHIPALNHFIKGENE